MLRLWPETLYASLFPGTSWLIAGRGPSPVLKDSTGDDIGDLLVGLDTLLSALPRKARGRMRLHLTVSDSVGTMAMLPWQEKLSGQVELDAYARAYLERDACHIDESWVTYTCFRKFRSGGLAYALPRLWMGELIAVCEKFQVRLETVLPVSAAAYWRTEFGRGSAQRLLVLIEPHRLSALVYDVGRLMLVDVQPITHDFNIAGTRLLLRIFARYQAIGEVRYWSACDMGTSLSPQFIRACLPNAVVSQLSQNEWNRR